MRISYAESKQIEKYYGIEEVEPENTVTVSETFDPLDFSGSSPKYVPLELFTVAEDHESRRIKPRISTQSGKGLCDIPDGCPAKVVEYGKTVEVIRSLNSTKPNGLSKIRKLSADEYINTGTGEIKKYKKNQNRAKPLSVANLNDSIRKLKRLILANFSDGEGLFVTLAYDDFMDDYTVAQKDYTKFYDKLKYYCKSHLGIDNLVYIRVTEPKASGSWHFHILLKSQDGKPLTLSEDWLRKKWGQKSVAVTEISNVKGLAFYLGRSTETAFNDGWDENDDGIYMLNERKYARSRRRFYLSHMKLYTPSQNLKAPTENDMTYEEAMEKVAGYKKTDESFSIVRYGSASNGYHIINTTNYETYEKS